MKKKLLTVTAALLSVLILTGVFIPGCAATDNDDADVKEFDQQNTAVAGFVHDFTYPSDDYSFSRLADYVVNVDYKIAKPFGVSIDVPQAGTLTLIDGDNRMSTKVKAGSQTIYNLTPGRISTYLVSDAEGNIVASGRIRPTGSLRMIFGKKTQNIRDLGGWACDGGVVKYGLLFRGAEIQEPDIALFHDMLGIRAELNLRWADEVKWDSSPIGDDVDFKHICGPWYTIGTDDEGNWSVDAHRQILDYIMDAVIEGRPLYFHCAEGADRTGTVAFILESLLGVSQSDTDKDYELTTFRSGIGSDNTARRRDESDWKDYMEMFRAYPGDTMRDKVVSWAVSKGVSIDKINAYRAAMIDGEPELLSAPEMLLGDIDYDREVSVIDLTILQRSLASMEVKFSEPELMRGDADGSGLLETIDATYIQRWLADMRVPYPIGNAI